MTITTDRRELYPALTTDERAAVDAAYDEVQHVLKEHGFRVIGDDRAENLVGAIARFLEDSKE
jgi:hypothetical protein